MSTRSKGGGGGGSRKRPRVALASKWPEYVVPKDKGGTDVPFPSDSPLHGLDRRIWDALAHVDPHLFKQPGQEAAFRPALTAINMGWVATNNQRVRPAKGGLFRRAQEFFAESGWMPPAGPLPEVRPVEVEDVEWDCGKAGELEFVVVQNGRKDSECTFPANISRRAKECLDGTGMCVIRGAADKLTIQRLWTGNEIDGCYPEATKIEETGTVTKIQYTSGNGIEGEEIYEDTKGKPIGSYYTGLKKSACLDRLQRVLVNSLTDEVINVADERKYIMLSYSNGGENYAHRDGELKSFPYQALLMLSNSEEYDGGSFYVAKRSEAEDDNVKFVRTCSPKLDAGDLVIFQANKTGAYCHGMKPVTRGKRVAVGLLQE